MAQNGNKKQCKFINYVRKDGVMKEQINQQFVTRNKWAPRWGFILEEQRNLLDLAQRENVNIDLHKKSLQKRSNYFPLNESGPIVGWKLEKSKSLPPKTTSGQVGYRSFQTLEVFGQLYVSPKCTINPPGTDCKDSYYNILLG